MFSNRPSIEACTGPEKDDEDFIRKSMYELVKRIIDEELKVDQVTPALKEIVTQVPKTAGTLADVVYMFDIETAGSSKRQLYLQLVKSLREIVLSDILLRERLDFDVSEELGLIQSKKLANTKYIKLKTRLFYKQQKFNLLREESEGYAKLVSELCQDGPFEVDYMLQVIRSLIGCFSLDPNRVVDIILEIFEERVTLEHCFIPLIKKFFDNSQTITQILGFKLSFYKDKKTPESLHILIAVLLQHKLVHMNDIYPFLGPKDEILRLHFDYEMEEAKRAAKRAVVISTRAAEEPKELPFSQEEANQLIQNNQKIFMLQALLKLGNYEDCERMMEFMPENYAFTISSEVCRMMCILISVSVDKLYRENSGLSDLLAKKIPPYYGVHMRYTKPVETRRQFIDEVVPKILTTGPFLYLDTLLLVKLTRILKSFLEAEKWDEDISQHEMKACIYTVLQKAILPAVTLTESNCGLSEELWQLFQLFPYHQRFRLYNEWKKDTTNPILMKTRATTLHKIKYFMKRLSKETVKSTGRHLGKISHSNPAFLFDNILPQIQSYDNLILPVVDSFKYLTSLSLDVLVYCIIEILSDPRKGRTKHEGATISPWVISISNFCGAVVKKYPVELPGLFQFIANQLKDEKSLDLLILKEIVTKMAGIEATTEMTNEQLSALSGGELLRQEGGYFTQVRNTRKSSNRLKDALLENDLAIPLIMMIAQQRDCIMYKEHHSHLKLTGSVYDQCQETLVQFGSFLSNCLSIDDYSGRLPDITSLLKKFNLSPDVTFFLVRPMIMHKVSVKFEENKKDEKGKLRAGLDLTKTYQTSWEEITTPVAEAVSSTLNEDLNGRFFVTFWTLSMYDIDTPKESYEREIEKIRGQIEEIQKNELNPNKKRKDIERINGLIEKLLEELLKQQGHVTRIKSRLEFEKEIWFQAKSLRKVEMVTQFLQHCLFPRCIFTASDALFCAKFVYQLHMLRTPNFSTLICYDRIFGDITYTMCSCSENEANHYGRFLCAIMETVTRWHRDKIVFERECFKYPGFYTKSVGEEHAYVDYEDYRHVCHKWHYRITKALILCLDSEDYVQTRNSLLVMTKINPFFPVISNFAQAIEKRIETIRNKEKNNRKDLYALATGYAGMLNTKKASFVQEQDFHQKDTKPKAASASIPNPPVVHNNGKTPPIKSEPVDKNGSNSNSNNVSGREKGTTPEVGVTSIKKESTSTLLHSHPHTDKGSQIKKETPDKQSSSGKGTGAGQGSTSSGVGMGNTANDKSSNSSSTPQKGIRVKIEKMDVPIKPTEEKKGNRSYQEESPSFDASSGVRNQRGGDNRSSNKSRDRDGKPPSRGSSPRKLSSDSEADSSREVKRQKKTHDSSLSVKDTSFERKPSKGKDLLNSLFSNSKDPNSERNPNLEPVVKKISKDGDFRQSDRTENPSPKQKRKRDPTSISPQPGQEPFKKQREDGSKSRNGEKRIDDGSRDYYGSSIKSLSGVADHQDRTRKDGPKMDSKMNRKHSSHADTLSNDHRRDRESPRDDRRGGGGGGREEDRKPRIQSSSSNPRRNRDDR